MSYPPYPPDPNRPQDTPRDQPPNQYPTGTPPPSFPTYGRPEQPQYQGGPQYPDSQYQVPPQYPPQYGYGYGYPGIPQVKTNGLAVAALVCGLVGIFFWITAPVAVGLGIAALVQIKRRRESGTAQAVIGLSIGGLVTVALAAFIVFLVAVDWNEGTDYGSDQPVAVSSASPDQVYVDDLIVGECFDDGFDEGKAVRQPCPELHDAELISNVTLPAGAYPGDDKVKESARLACRQEFTKYIGISPDKSVRKSSYWWPDADLWDDGDRVVVCAAYGAHGAQLRGSVKGTKH